MERIAGRVTGGFIACCCVCKVSPVPAAAWLRVPMADGHQFTTHLTNNYHMLVMCPYPEAAAAAWISYWRPSSLPRLHEGKYEGTALDDSHATLTCIMTIVPQVANTRQSEESFSKSGLFLSTCRPRNRGRKQPTLINQLGTSAILAPSSWHVNRVTTW